MKKISNLIIKMIMLITMIFSSFQTPIYVLADEISDNTEGTTPQYEKGDMRLGEDGEITKDGTVTVPAGSADLNTAGNIQVTKTVTAVPGTDGRYQVDFFVQGTEVPTTITTTKPIYFVIVFDTSGSMICDKSLGGYSVVVNSNPHYTAEDGTKIRCRDYWNDYDVEDSLTQTKWENAVTGAINFANQLVTMENTYVSLVTFASSVSTATDFTRELSEDETIFEASDFGHPNGGTNLDEAIDEAQDKLNTITDENAQKYILVIGDGDPDSDYYTKVSANAAKDEGTKIYAIGYGIEPDSSAEEILKYISSNTTVTPGENWWEEEENYEDKGYYQTTGTSGISSALQTVFESVGEPAKAGTSATITDGIGNQFKIVTETGEDVSDYGVDFVSDPISEITETGTTVSFYIQINPDAETGWYDTNENFSLSYTDPKKEVKTIDCTTNPQVYWVQNEYDYTVNYYKDSITNANLIATETRQAPNGTIINESNVEKDKYLSQAGEGYEFNSVTPTSITVTNDGQTKVINVLYTVKKYSYNVNYYYDNVLDTTLPISNVTHGTTVNPTDYYLNANEIKEGYKLDTVNTDKTIITIDSNGKSINIYYIKDSFEFTVNYHFNEILGLTKKESAIYNEEVKAEEHYLTNDELTEKNYSDYFLHPITPSNPTKIQIGTNPDKNVLNIYYINTFVQEETIDKTTTNNKITSSEDLVKYQVVYNSTVKNVKANEEITITIVDTLPYEIDLTKSKLNNGIYNNKTITWTIEKTVSEFTENYEINETINYEVVYKNFENLSSNEENNKLKNNVIGKTTVANKTTQGIGDYTETPVEIYGDLIVKYEDENGETLADQVTTTELAGTAYETKEKTIYGYTFDHIDGNATGKYKANETITVTYVYTKKAGTTETNKVEKVGPANIKDVNGVFNYTLKYTGKITDYVGKATLTLTDTLPYELDLDKSTFEGCTYENKVLTCTKEYEIDEKNQDVIAEFNLSLTFKNVDSNKVTNKLESTLDYGKDTPDTSKDETETEVFKGTVIAKYEDANGKTLADSITTTDLAGTDYETKEKTIYGYTFDHIDGNATGKYKANETITVIYVYTKKEGKTTENVLTKEQKNETIVGTTSTFKYVLTYHGKIEEYVGPATVTIEDILPFSVSSIKYDEELCTYDETLRKITCTKTVEITETNKAIDAEFEIVVTYKNLTSTTDLEVTNTATSTLDYGKEIPDTDTDEVTDTVKSGTVVAKYEDANGKTLADSVTTTGLIDTEYETEEKEIYGYTLKEVQGEETGKYTEETITVTYVYTKNEGTTETNEVTKVGPENITSVNGVFNYTLTYTGKITDYVGKATLTLKDTLPYELDLDKSTYEGCTYENKVLTCTKEYDIDENNQDVNAEFNLSLVFKNIDSNKVTNKLESTLDYGKDTPDTSTDETETEVFKGTVIATYKNTNGETLAENITQEGLAGSNYETEELEFLGYTLTQVPTNQNGTYRANETIYVDYIYDKNIGTSEENLEKLGPDKIQDVNDPFEYKIKYNLEIFDYVGDVKITLTDYLPYEIDEEKSDIGDICKYVDGKLVCEYLETITNQENRKIFIEENLVLYYKNITSNEVTNRVEAVVVYGEEEKVEDDEFATEVSYGTVKVNYVTEEGKKLSETIITTDLVGRDYTTEAKTFDNYHLKEVIGETKGTYKEEEIEVTYVYSLTPLPPQTGVNCNQMNYLGVLIFSLIVLVLKRRYL